MVRRAREKSDKDKFLEPPPKIKPSEHEAMIAKILAREFQVPIPGYVKVNIFTWLCFFLII